MEQTCPVEKECVAPEVEDKKVSSGQKDQRERAPVPGPGARLHPAKQDQRQDGGGDRGRGGGDPGLGGTGAGKQTEEVSFHV